MGPGLLISQGFTSWGLGGNSKDPRSAGIPKAEEAMPLCLLTTQHPNKHGQILVQMLREALRLLLTQGIPGLYDALNLPWDCPTLMKCLLVSPQPAPAPGLGHQPEQRRHQHPAPGAAQALQRED